MAGPSLHIGLVGSVFWPIIGGMETYLREVARALVEQGHRVSVATRFVDERPPDMRRLLTTAEDERCYDQNGMHVHVLAPAGWRRHLLRPTYRLHFYPTVQPVAVDLFCAALYRQMSTALEGCDVVHYSGTGRELLGFCAARIAAAMGVPFVVTTHMHILAWGDGPLDLSLYRQADVVIALTEFEQAFLIDQGVEKDRVRVQGHGVNVRGNGSGERFRATYGVDGPMILYLGRKAEYKGYTRVLDAAPEVWRAVPDARFVLAGPADPGLCVAPGQAQTLADRRVIDLPAISDQEREDAFAACDVFCLPSRAEAFGLVYLEAWRYRKPVVALAIPTLEELIGCAGGGVLIPPDAGDLPQALIRLLTDPTTRECLGEAGFQATRTHTWAHVARSLLEVYQQPVSSFS